MSCNHDINPFAGYGATVGIHTCIKCGERITWKKDKYVLAHPKVKEVDYESHNLCIAGVWGLIAVIILLISGLTIAKYA